MSLDVYARTFALFEGIKTETLHDDKSTVPKFAFLKKIELDSSIFNSLDKGEDIGYLSGNDEKFRIYNMAIQDTLEFIAKKQLKKSENKDNPESIETKISDLQSKYCIETLWPGEARGKTISSAIVIMALQLF